MLFRIAIDFMFAVLGPCPGNMSVTEEGERTDSVT
jgi:hypothetical protein